MSTTSVERTGWSKRSSLSSVASGQSQGKAEEGGTDGGRPEEGRAENEGNETEKRTEGRSERDERAKRRNGSRPGPEQKGPAEEGKAGKLSTRKAAVGSAEGGSAGGRWPRVQKRLKTRLGDDVYSSWFASMEVEGQREATLRLSVPHVFLRNWIRTHYVDELLTCCRAEIKDVENIELVVRDASRVSLAKAESNGGERASEGTAARLGAKGFGGERDATSLGLTRIGDFQGSPLDPRLTFASFVVGTSNRLAHAAARQVSETLLDRPLGFNPLYIHSNVGLGKTHLLHAIAWDVRRRHPSAKVLYLTAERFRYRFVEALKSKEAFSFKENLRNIDILLIDDMEFLQGERTEQEFEDTLNALLDSGKQVVVASARAPAELDSLNSRLRSRLSGGLVTELTPLDYDLRRRILERRVDERRATDPTFQIAPEVIDFLAERLTESGRELDGAVTRLYAACHLTGTPITRENAEHIIRDLMRGMEPKRIKIEDILKLVSKHYGVSRTDILSQRRQRSIVWPRQIGMYLAKQLTQRSLPEIGRRFGGRDHTTVLHAIRKIDGEIAKDQRLKDEIEDLKRLLNN